MIDFTAYELPSLAVACPICHARVGVRCKRPSGHAAFGGAFHKERGAEADRVFIAQHGEAASIDSTPQGWVIDPQGYAKRQAREARQAELPL